MIRLNNLIKNFGSKIILDRASYHFPSQERIALVGDNGTGKSTLLNMISSQESYESGEVIIPEKIKLGYLPQEPNPNPKATVALECQAGDDHLSQLKQEMTSALQALEKEHQDKLLLKFEKAESAFKAAGGYSLEARALSILKGLGFSPSQCELSPKNLSGGWRMRLELAKLFLKEPDFLILDEPTNHLDLPSLVWVENYLQSFGGTLLFVSHDRDLLNRLATISLHLNNGQLTPYKGNYDQFLAAYSLKKAQDEKKMAQIQKKSQNLENFIQRFGAKASKASQAQSKLKMLESLEKEADKVQAPQVSKSCQFQLPPPEKSERILYKIIDASIGYDTPLSRGIHFEVERGKKIAIIGANGIGKSTLLRTMHHLIPELAGQFIPSPRTQIAYFSQDQLQTFDGDKTIIDNLMARSQLGDKELRQILGGFFI